MAEITGSKERQQNQQAYKEYLEQLEAKSKARGIQQDTLEALDQLKEKRAPYQPVDYVEPAKAEPPKPSTYDDPEETRMREFQRKVAPYQTWGSMAGMPLIAKDTFAPMFSGTSFASNARDYMFNRRVNLMQRQARVDRDEATRLVGRLDPSATRWKSDSTVEQMARDRYFARTGSPLSENEAVRWAQQGIKDQATKSGAGLREAQYKYLGIDPNQHHFGFTLNRMIKQKAIGDFENRQTGVRAQMGRVLYGSNRERQDTLRNLPIDLSSDTAVGRAAQLAGAGAGAGLTALPAFSVGLGSAANYQKLQNLRRDRHITGRAGKVAETGLTTANLLRAAMFAPAATMMAAPAFGALTKGAGFLGGKAIEGGFGAAGNILGGLGNLVGSGIGKLGGDIPILSQIMQTIGAVPKMLGGAADLGVTGIGNVLGGGANILGKGAGSLIEAGGHGLYRGAKDFAFGTTSAIGGGALKGISGLSNMLTGGNMDLGASLATAAKGTGLGATMAGIAPSLMGGLALALPGIVGGISGHMADRKRRIMRGFKQPTDKLVKQFSRSRGIDGVIRNLFSTNEITSDRMLELQLLMYIEQNTSSIPKMVSDTGLMVDRKEKDANATVDEFQNIQDRANQYDGGMFARAGRGAKYAWSRGLTGMQEFAHTINIPGQIMDFLINRRTPWSRKEEFRQAKEDALFEFKSPKHTQQVAQRLGTSASHVKLLAMPATQIIRQSGAESADAQQVALQSAIYDLLRFQFGGKTKRDLKKEGIDMTPDASVDEMTGWRKIAHRIPGISSFASAYDAGNKMFEKGKGIFNFFKNLEEHAQDFVDDARDISEGRAGGGKTRIGRWLSGKLLGKEQQEQFTKGTATKGDMGLFTTSADKIEAFQLKLPDLWAELLHLQRISVDALHNLFNVGNALLKCMCPQGQGVQYQSSGSEQKHFDYSTGKYHTTSEYNEMVDKRREEFTSKMTSTPGRITSMFRKFFGAGHAEDETSRALTEFMDKDEQMTRKASSSDPGILGMLARPLLNQGGFLDVDNKYTKKQITGPQLVDERGRPISSATTTVDKEMDEHAEKEEKKKRDDSRKSLKDNFGEVIKLLKKGLGVSSGKEGEKNQGFFGKLLGNIGSIAGSIFNFAKIAIPVLAGLKIFSKLNEYRSDGGSAELGTGAFGKATDTKAHLLKAGLTYGGYKGAELLTKHADTIATGGATAAVKAGMSSGGVKGGAMAAGKVASKVGIKVGGKTAAVVLKKVPFLGALIGGGLAIGRTLKGDFKGAAMELASGLTSFVPGPGWAVGLAIDAAILARDIALARERGEEPSPELIARAQEMDSSAKKNLSKRAYDMYGQSLDKLKDLAEDGLLRFNKKDKKWYTKEEAHAMIKEGTSGFTEKKGLLGGFISSIGGLFDRGKPKEDPGDGFEWKRVDHMFGATWEKVPSKGRKIDQYQHLKKTDADREWEESQKPKSFLRKVFDWTPAGLAVRGVKWQAKQWGEAFTAVNDAKDAMIKYMKNAVIERWNKILGGIKNWFTGVWDGAKNWVKDKYQSSKDMVKNIGMKIYEGTGLKKLVDWGKGTWDKLFGEGSGESGPGLFGRAKNWIADHTPAALIKRGANVIERKFNDGVVASEERERVLNIHRQRLKNAEVGQDGWVQTADGEWQRKVTDVGVDLRRRPGETDEQYNRRIRITGKDVAQGKMDFGYGTESIYNPTIKQIQATSRKRKFTKQEQVQEQRRQQLAGIKAKDTTIMKSTGPGTIPFFDSDKPVRKFIQLPDGSWIEDASQQYAKSEAIKPIGPDVIGLRKQMQTMVNKPDLEEEYFSKAVHFNQRKATPQQMAEAASNTRALRQDDELPTVKAQMQEAAQVKIPSHSSAPSAMNAGVAGSKSQEVKDRPINPMMESFIENLFANTINVFQQSIKSFAIGQTPFQILR